MDSLECKIGDLGDLTLIELGDSGVTVPLPIKYLSHFSAVLLELREACQEAPLHKRPRIDSQWGPSWGSSWGSSWGEALQENPRLCRRISWIVWMAFTLRRSPEEDEAIQEVGWFFRKPLALAVADAESPC